jgi:hypothetical protein
MMQGINTEDVKKYNASLKQYQDKANQVKAGIDYNTKELNRLCEELSAELGVQVTPENIRQIRDERIAKIQNTLDNGKEILRRIQAEEAAANTIQAPQVTQTPQVTPQVTAEIPGIFSASPVAPQINQSGATAPSFEQPGPIPPIFGI